MRVTTAGIVKIASASMGIRNCRLRTFKAHFCFSPRVVSRAWNDMVDRHVLPRGAAPYHLLWMLYFVKSYPNNETGGTATGSDRNTFQKWCKQMAKAVSKLDKVSYEVPLSDIQCSISPLTSICTYIHTDTLAQSMARRCTTTTTPHGPHKCGCHILSIQRGET